MILYFLMYTGLHTQIRFSKVDTASTANTTEHVERQTLVKSGIWKKERKDDYVRCIDRQGE